MMCGIATAAAFLIGGSTNVHAAENENIAGKVTVHYRLYAQRILEITTNEKAQYNDENWEENWYEESFDVDTKIKAEDLNKTILSELYGTADFLSEEDMNKIKDQKITWYVSRKMIGCDESENRRSSNPTPDDFSISALKTNEFDFSKPLTEDVYLEGVIEETKDATDTKWMFWAILSVAGLIIVVGIVMAVIRNRSTRMSLDNHGLMTEDSKHKLDEIRSIESRKEKYSPLNDGVDE